MTVLPPRLDPADVEAIVGLIADGGVLLLPTDTVYGLCCDPRDADAVERIYTIKGRRSEVPLAVLVSGTTAATPIVDGARSSFDLDSLDSPDWPGELTVVLPMDASSRLASGVGVKGDLGTIGVRCPTGRFIADVVAMCGVVAATSANAHGHPSLTDPREILDQLGSGAHGIVGYVDGGRLELAASSVVSVGSAGWTVLRGGELSNSRLVELLGPDEVGQRD